MAASLDKETQLINIEINKQIQKIDSITHYFKAMQIIHVDIVN